MYNLSKSIMAIALVLIFTACGSSGGDSTNSVKSDGVFDDYRTFQLNDPGCFTPGYHVEASLYPIGDTDPNLQVDLTFDTFAHETYDTGGSDVGVSKVIEVTPMVTWVYYYHNGALIVDGGDLTYYDNSHNPLAYYDYTTETWSFRSNNVLMPLHAQVGNSGTMPSWLDETTHDSRTGYWEVFDQPGNDNDTDGRVILYTEYTTRNSSGIKKSFQAQWREIDETGYIHHVFMTIIQYDPNTGALLTKRDLSGYRN